MEKTTTDLTNEYIKEHPDVKSCLKKNLINYSSLARRITKDLQIEKKSSKEAILIAARRFYDKLKKESGNEKDIKNLLSKSELNVNNKIAVFILEKGINFDYVDELQKKIRTESGKFYILEGSASYTIITQERYSELTEQKFKPKIIKKRQGLALIDLKSSEEIERTVGVLAYLTALFSENGVNIVEFFSCWTDTLFIIEAKDVNKALSFLSFSSQ